MITKHRLSGHIITAAVSLCLCAGLCSCAGTASTDDTSVLSSDVSTESVLSSVSSSAVSEEAKPPAAALTSSSSSADQNSESTPADEAAIESTPSPEPGITPEAEPEQPSPYENGQAIWFDENWEFASYSVINSGNAVMYTASSNRKNIIIGVNAGHGTSGGSSVYTYCHPDQTPKVTGGSTSEGAVQATAVSSGMTLYDGTPEYIVTLREAQILKDTLLEQGYDVLMIRDGEDVQLDNIARTVMCNNIADCHIALHWDGDGLSYDKGAFYMSVPDALKYMYPVSVTWDRSEALGDCLISGLSSAGRPLFESGSMDSDLTQTSYSTVPSVDIELGNAASDHSDEVLYNIASGLAAGVDLFYGS